jgi:hypothetical protein
MLSHAYAVTAPRRVPPNGPSSRPPGADEPDAVPLEGLGSVEHEDQIVVLGGNGPELMCALLRAGAENVIHLRLNERPEPGTASLLIVPRVPSLDWLATALGSIRRALTPDGRLKIFVGPHQTTQTQIRRMLTLHGFTAIRANGLVPDGQVLGAEIRDRHSGSDHHA